MNENKDLKQAGALTGLQARPACECRRFPGCLLWCKVVR